MNFKVGGPKSVTSSLEIRVLWSSDGRSGE
jgi:hypothetical protein